MSNDKSNRRPLFKIALFLVCAIAIFLGLNTLYSFANTLNRLDVIESERATSGNGLWRFLGR